MNILFPNFFIFYFYVLFVINIKYSTFLNFVHTELKISKAKIEYLYLKMS